MSEGIDITDLKDLEAWVKENLVPLSSPSLFLLSGDLGAGKTQLVRTFCELHGFTEVQSPTFAIHNQYKWESKIQNHLIQVEHVDLYRLETEDDIESSGFWDLFSAPQGYLFVEWSERLQETMIPQTLPVYHLKFSKQADPKPLRTLEFKKLF